VQHLQYLMSLIKLSHSHHLQANLNKYTGIMSKFAAKSLLSYNQDTLTIWNMNYDIILLKHLLIKIKLKIKYF